ncbi:MAG TPA: hypothetical protein PKW15_03765 [Alphaproteobacteria bacterium]|nr:hypothetical protein [Rhodospirillaceae bacterium]HRJ12344.1 hypothetical protein [Alphaproteobacteria bacterium]
MKSLRAALEKLDEAIDQLDELAAVSPTSIQTPVMQSITPRSPSEIYRAELIRRLDETIEDVQQMMEQAA